MSDVIPTRSALIECKEERHALYEGHVFLDEMCLLLAGEIVAELRRSAALEADFLPACKRATAALVAATGRHGLEELLVYPVPEREPASAEIIPRSLVGVRLLEAHLHLTQPAQPQQAVNASPEARDCRAAFADVIEMAAPLAAVSGNLERLYLAYRRALRRARALQDVLLPELDRTVYALEAGLEDLEREDAIAMRLKTASAGIR
ncbi:V-type ATP synthase subunit D [Noviherbaspirillum sedimenti]|uniref:ATPase n=1 Tax=Noviherbaspirillum sedimenti TaxID=2320865 RepID=A0A3A3FW06_9BURK|nr:V-type ATP synthase subunit D [Noviherbaspirillum sedimenti]RJG00383.1 ATPase [Noviherbaspirillum sedimenti]